MRCKSCGKSVADDDGAEFDTTNVPTGPGSKYAYTRTAPVWICSDCANYRRGTFRLVYGLAVAAVIACLLLVVLNWLWS